jgi:tripeptide aminopeptidase
VTLQEEQAVDRVMQLIRIPGGSGHELPVANHISQLLLQAGVAESAIQTDTAHRRSPAGGDTGNLIVRLKGTVRGPRRLLMAHMDTVPLAVGCTPVRDGDWIRPKSAATALGGDNRAGCAVVLTAVLELLRQQLDHPPLTLLFTVQEETGLRGARFLTPARLGRPELCFNWDGRQPGSLIVGAVGASNLTLTVEGIASHAGVHPEQGVNALVAASQAIADLQEHGWHGLVLKGRRRGTSNIGIVQGGDATNVVMPSVILQAEARSHDSGFRQRIVAEFRKAFEKSVRKLKSSTGRAGQLTFVEDVRYQAFQIPPDSPCVQTAAESLTRLNVEPEIRLSDGGLDANWMMEHGFPTVTMGCGQHQIHTVDEKLSIPEYLTACRMALSLATASR